MNTTRSDASNELAILSYEQLKASGFFETDLAKNFLSQPLGIVDIGARWGVNTVFDPIAPLLNVISFEPDEEEVKEVAKTESQEGKWANFSVYPYALGNRNGTENLYLLKRPNNSSIYPVNTYYYERYKLIGYELDKILSVPMYTLDYLIASNKIPQKNTGEVIKLDTQGAEKAILEGAVNTITQNTYCIICEAGFFTPYHNACLFTDIETILRKQGFQFYGFVDFKFRSTKRIDKKRSIGRERMMQADAIFFKDPLEEENNFAKTSHRHIAVTFTMALVLGYFDFCLEILDRWELNTQEKEHLKKVVLDAAYPDPKAIIEYVAQLNKTISTTPSLAIMEVGRLIDQQRDYHSFHDVTCAIGKK